MWVVILPVKSKIYPKKADKIIVLGCDRVAQLIAKNTRCYFVVVEKSNLVQKSITGEITIMIIAQIESQIRYVTNVEGTTV